MVSFVHAAENMFESPHSSKSLLPSLGIKVGVVFFLAQLVKSFLDIAPTHGFSSGTHLSLFLPSTIVGRVVGQMEGDSLQLSA